uniref:Uncharacterized protein n=1 Tax=Arundo donax TaxID=35708 RepID=A0A0A9C1C1_ARUDO
MHTKDKAKCCNVLLICHFKFYMHANEICTPPYYLALSLLHQKDNKVFKPVLPSRVHCSFILFNLPCSLDM